MTVGRARAAVLAAALVIGGGAAGAQEGPPQIEFALGDTLRVRIPASMHVDGRVSEGSADDGMELQRLRLGASGTLLRRIDFQIERELSDTRLPWRDVFVDVALHRPLKVRAGRFKIPISLDYQTSMVQHPFVYRSMAGASLSLNRNTGVMAHGTVVKGLKYYASVFPAQDEHGATAAARVTYKLKPVTVAAAIASRRDAEGPLSVRTRTPDDDPMFPDLLVNGRRLHAGVEAEWHAGDFSGRVELLRASQQRLGQGVDDNDLDDLVMLGWYATVAWRRFRPLELAGRVERLGLRSGDGAGPAAVTPRAAAIAGEGARAITVGCNWYPAWFLRLQANSILAQREQAGRFVPGGRWTHVVRVQLEI